MMSNPAQRKYINISALKQLMQRAKSNLLDQIEMEIRIIVNILCCISYFIETEYLLAGQIASKPPKSRKENLSDIVITDNATCICISMKYTDRGIFRRSKHLYYFLSSIFRLDIRS